MKTNVLRVAIRNQAIYVADTSITVTFNKEVFSFVENVRKLGFGLSEELWNALKYVDSETYQVIYNTLQDILGTKHNWTPLVKDWLIPTGETDLDHYITYMANWFGTSNDEALSCGHKIPKKTFPLERYNGCPFCGTPFEFEQLELRGGGSKMKVLDLWQDQEATTYLEGLIKANTALDATQIDSLKLLLAVYPLPTIEVRMKETMMLLVDYYVEADEEAKAGALLKSPTDIMRYLWYKKTGVLQLILPKTIIARQAKNHAHFKIRLDSSNRAKEDVKENLKLKYSRKEALMVATWLNEMAMDIELMCENMHPKRGMWIRFIRALRLAEYCKRTGFEQLAELLDVFYNQIYTVTAGRIEHYRLKMDADRAFALLKSRPGLFARSLFSSMLCFGDDVTLEHFAKVVDKVPMRLLLTLNMYADTYFDPTASRVVKPLGGVNKVIAVNQWVKAYDEGALKAMVGKIESFVLTEVMRRFAMQKNENKTIYISEELYNIPLAIGDRADNVQDLPVALMGTKFPLEGYEVRLFMQWGAGLPAQHLDMDLSCHIAYVDKVEVCSYYSLSPLGCQHSGDIRSIPNQIGTAEYINIDVQALRRAKAKYITFTSNAYSNGAITPNLVVGWMDTKYPMTVSNNKGVAYDPSAVIHQVRVTNSLTKGLVFGVLDVEKGEIIWLEMAFGGQNIQSLDSKTLNIFLKKLEAKTKVADLLMIKAQAQGMNIVYSVEEADEVYDAKWAIDSANVMRLIS
ncbi:TerD family protein [Myroides odoratimimus]|uniref:Prokaryotic RING finger family 4 n=1 Tax=Myroides odoratimimus CIP 101113 TaxID=883154 RepID=A0AAV3F0K7_9FLAO|nr:hypothetical protein [Myroides odoratimimus]EHO06416.1 hypothetical protein HMPREF9715_03137 [Myroides odoratimimus CIP 101113]